jgi:hypothetical protein
MPNFPKRLRHQLILGKLPVIEVIRGLTNQTIILSIADKYFLRTTCPLTSDVKVGDLLTLYTEVLAQERH